MNMLSHNISKIIIPVTLCLLYVVVLVRILELNMYKNPSLFEKTWNRLGVSTKESQNFTSNLLNNLIIVAIFAALILIVTLMVLLVLYMEWHKCLTYYFYIPSLLIMVLISPAYMREVGNSLNWFSIDLITLSLLVWNFACLGMMAIFGIYAVTPLAIQQLYLIHNSSILSVLILYALPGWAPWLLLIVVVFWDLFAVLAPFGPLRMIINLAEDRGIVDMPGLLYNTSISHEKVRSKSGSIADESEPLEPKTTVDSLGSISLDEIDATGSNSSLEEMMDKLKSRSKKSPSEIKSKSVGHPSKDLKHKPMGRLSVISTEDSESLEKGVTIGLGDFIFYGILIGLCAKGGHFNGFYAVISAFVAIIFGLALTLMILAKTGKAIPALPISIAIGLIVAALSLRFTDGFMNGLASDQIFI